MTAKKRRASKAAAPKVAAAAKADVAKKTRARRKSKPKKNGRPIAHTPALARAVCERLAEGKSLRDICKLKSMPVQSTIRLWVVDDVEGFSAQYWRARDVGLDVQGEDLLAMSDSAQGKDSAGVQAVSLRIKTRQWYLSKLAPKRYGDRLDLNVDAKVEVRELTDDQLEGRIDGLFKKLYTGLAGMQQQRQETADAD
jgi:hypothetical protein